jgi:hypothetical protein
MQRYGLLDLGWFGTVWALFDRTMVAYWSRQPCRCHLQGMTLLYWRIGRRISREVLGQ